MIVTPPVFTPIHEEETNYLSPNSEEIIKKMIRNSNFLLDLAPVGTIIWINPNQLGGGQPSSRFWQICDGSEITDANSPLRSIGLELRYTPNLRNNYPCGTNNPTSNPSYGSHNHSLQHSHTTGGANTDGGGLKKKGNRNRRNPHGHILATQYDEVTTIEAPAYVYLIAYMKIV